MYPIDIPVDDRLAIQALVAEYSYLCDTKQYDKCSALFAEDGVFDETVILLPLVEGRDMIHQIFCGMDGQIEFLVHVTGNHRVADYSGDAASGTIHLHCEGTFHGDRLHILGYYADDYVKQDGKWLFKQRKLVEIAPSVTPFGALAAG